MDALTSSTTVGWLSSVVYLIASCGRRKEEKEKEGGREGERGWVGGKERGRGREDGGREDGRDEDIQTFCRITHSLSAFS